MIYKTILSEIYNQHLAIHPGALLSYRHIVARMLRGDKIAVEKKEENKLSFFNSEANDITEETEEEQDLVAVIRMNGPMTKFGDWCMNGTEDYAQMLYNAYADESIKAVVILMHSPGGSTASVLPLEAAIKQRNKPVIGVVDSEAFSAGYYSLLFCDKIIAIDKMAEVGSIGVMAILQDDSKMKDEIGINERVIIPPESKWKNKAYYDAIENEDDSLYIEEKLSPWAVHFQNQVKENRKKLNLEVEGIIEGRTFYAYDALENGLIDAIMPFTDVIPYALELAEQTNKFNQILQ